MEPTIRNKSSLFCFNTTGGLSQIQYYNKNNLIKPNQIVALLDPDGNLDGNTDGNADGKSLIIKRIIFCKNEKVFYRIRLPNNVRLTSTAGLTVLT